MRTGLFQCTIAVLVLAAGQPSAAQQNSPSPAGPVKQVQEAVQSYEMAFNDRDVEKLVAHWSPEGVYLNRLTGEKVVGQAAMTEAFTSLFSQADVPELKLATESIDLVSPNVALESGTATILRANQDVVTTGYSVVFVKRGDRWLIDRVSEVEAPAPPSNYDHLKPLEWLIGEWVEKEADASVNISTQWTKNRNFISRTYSVKEGEQTISSGLQVIGWDAKNQQIRSWLFDSDGGVVTGKWTQREDRWVVNSVAHFRSGKTGSFTSIFRPIDDRSYGWEKVNRMIEGKLMPNVDEVMFARQ